MLIYGDRIGKHAKLAPSGSAVIFDATRKSVLLIRRSDNGQWSLPGGAIDPGESYSECCAREVLEETGLMVIVGRLVGVYSSPHHIFEYADGNRILGLSLVFEAEVAGGELCISDETTEFGYFSQEEMNTMEVMKPIYRWVDDAFAGQQATFVR